MRKQLLKSGCISFFIGIALNEVIAVITSYRLRLGYFMPCLASLPEQVGGEMNAVVLQMLICGTLGLAIGVAWRIGTQRQWKRSKRLLSAFGSFILSILPTALVTVCMWK
ncbi:MAG: hypothetical protein PHI27_10170 [Eubacteriales bacterium]|nr:hypothetical protein [Eubacteriales bacterium]MDD4513441.1 hypothetical protein [Eubacteriales bacterium]